MNTKYGFRKQLENGLALDEVIDRTMAALKTEGFGVLADIDLRSTFQAKLNEDIGYEYRILAACNPPLAKKALSHEPMIGLLLPCNVLVEKRDDEVFVSVLNARALIPLVEAPEMTEIAVEVDDRLQRALEKL